MMNWYIENGPDSDVVVSSRVRLARNFKGYPFPFRMSKEQQEEILEKTKNAIFKGNEFMQKDFSFTDISSLNTIERYALVEKHIISKEIVNNKNHSGLILSSDEKISIMVNEEDHLRIQCLESGMKMDSAWETCNRIDLLLEEDIDFAFNESLGYLTCCPTNLGTAIRVSAMLHLPALTMTGYIRTILDACGKLGIAVRGLYGENTEATGNMFQLSNQVTLGKNEEDIIKSIKNITYQIIEQERILREELYKQNKHKFEDRIFRSYGVLQNARIINTDECLKKLSDVRLGVDMGIITEIKITSINEIMLMIQPGGLQKVANKEITPEERDVIRAELIRQKLIKQIS